MGGVVFFFFFRFKKEMGLGVWFQTYEFFEMFSLEFGIDIVRFVCLVTSKRLKRGPCL